jgi:hypothetical protein
MTEASDRSGIAARDPDGDPTDRIVAFLRGIGIVAREAALDDPAFLPGVVIAAGELVFDRARLTWPGDLLHEAGHIAVTPAAQRPLLPGLLDGPPIAFGGEVEATAWAYAATLAIGLAPEVLFHADGYQGRSADLVMVYSHGVYPGGYGLAQAGLARIGEEARRAGVAPYPHMVCWLRE